MTSAERNRLSPTYEYQLLRAERVEARLAALREATMAFLVKFDALMPVVNAAFAFHQNHGFTYGGPTWERELSDLRAALAASGVPR